VLKRVEIESKNEHCDQRLKIDSLREILRQKQPGASSLMRYLFFVPLLTRALPCAAVGTGDKSSSSSTGNPRVEPNSASSQAEQRQSDARASSAGAQPNKVVSLPSVVLKHAAASAETRKQRTRNQFDTSVAAVVGEDVPDVNPLNSPTRMTRQQRKAAGRSLGDYVQIPAKAAVDEVSAMDPASRAAPQTDDLLFLFPTVTKRRQLHGK
jgi:hypothetical protein